MRTMGLSDVQRVLASLLTSAPLRARFLADPVGVGCELDLNAEDIALLKAFSTQEVARCARSLQAKRWGEIEKLLPLTVRAAQGGHVPLAALFQQFSQTYVPHGAKRHALDAIAFTAWAGEQPASAFCSTAYGDQSGICQGNIPIKAPCAIWLPDLLRYEAAWLTANIDVRPRFCLIRRFRFSVHRMNEMLMKQSAMGSAIMTVSERSTLALWTRLSPKSRILFGVWSAPFSKSVRF